MKPPIVHPPVQPSQPHRGPDDGHDAVQPTDAIAADDVRYESTAGSRPGLVGDFGPLAGDAPDFDLAPAQERRRH